MHRLCFVLTVALSVPQVVFAAGPGGGGTSPLVPVVLFCAGLVVIVLLHIAWSCRRQRRRDMREAAALSERNARIEEVTGRFEQIINTAPVALMLTVDGVIVEANEYLTKHLGAKAGDPSAAFYTDSSQYEYLIERANHQHMVEQQIVRYHTADGGSNRFLATVSRIDYDGRQGYVHWAMDIEGYERQNDRLDTMQEGLQTILDTLPVPVRITDAESGRIVYANEMCLTMFGCDSLKEMYGRYAHETMPKFQPDGEPSADLVWRVIRSGVPMAVELLYEISGRSIEAQCTTRFIDYRDRNALLVIIRDLSKEREYLRTRQSLQKVLDVLPVPVRIFGLEDHRVIYVNQRCLELFGARSMDECIGRHASDFMPLLQPNGERSMEKLSRLNNSVEPSQDEFVCHDVHGRQFEALVTACVIEFNGSPVSLGLIQDLRAEKEYRRMLRDTAEKEKEANQLKSKFLVNMSHEIRTPMNAVMGLTELELRKELPEETKAVYKKIHSSAKHLLDIINDILDLSRIEADKIELHLDEFELEDVLESLSVVVAPRLIDKEVEPVLVVAPELPRYLIGDRARVWQILKNFMDNATKFTERGRIVLRVSVDERSDAESAVLAFVIEDTGIGIDEAQMQRVFMPYEQIYGEAQQRYSGSGLGMSISKQLCELMGGELAIESEWGVGTTIRMTIPFKRAANRETMREAISGLLAGTKVMVLGGGAVQELVESAGAACVTADTGETPDLILREYGITPLSAVDVPELLLIAPCQRSMVATEENLIEKPLLPLRFLHKLRTMIGLSETGETDDGLVQFTGVKVLLCEDQALNREIAAGMLEQFGITPAVAEDGRQGLALLRTDAVDLILMDLQMPVMDGYEAAREIRGDAGFDHIPIISLTADAMTEATDRCLLAGMNDHLPKPVRLLQMQEILLKWLPESKRAGTKAPPRATGKTDWYEKALRRFAQLLPEPWSAFEDAVEDREQTMFDMHKLKGVAGNLGLEAIHRYAAGFEKSMRDGKPDRALYAALIGAADSLKERITPAADSPRQAGATDELIVLTGKLRAALENDDPQACTQAVAGMQERTWAVDGLEKLYEYALGYEFEKALALLQQIELGQ